MSRSSTSILCIVAMGILLAACHDDPTRMNVLNPAETDAQHKLMNVSQNHDPPPEIGQHLLLLAARFETIDWVEVPLRLNLTGGAVVAEPDGYLPIEASFNANLDTPPPAGDQYWDCTLYVPAAPASGALSIPGECLIFRTSGFPPPEMGDVTLHLPVMDFLGADFAGQTISSFTLCRNPRGLPEVTDPQTTTLPGDSEPGSTSVMYVDVDITETDCPKDPHDEPSAATDRVLDTGTMGDEE